MSTRPRTVATLQALPGVALCRPRERGALIVTERREARRGVCVLRWYVEAVVLQATAVAHIDNLGFALCVPKIRFCNIGGAGHRELGVT